MAYYRFIDPLKKWWWLILISTVAAAAISYYVSSQQPSTYQSHATLIVGQPIDDPNPSGSDLATGQQLATTYADIAMRDPVRQAVAERLDLEQPFRYTVIALPRTQLLEISVSDLNPQRAQAIANAVAEELIALSPSNMDPEEQERLSFVSEQLTSLQNRITETEDELLAKQEELASLFNAQELTEAQNEVSALEAKLNTLQGNYASLLSNTQEDAVNVVSFIEPATLPRSPANNQQMMTILIAASVGFSLAVGAAYLIEFLDQTIRTADDIAVITDTKTLITVPHFSRRRYKSVLFAMKYPRSPISEVYRSLRSILRTNIDEKPGYVLLITSPNRSDGKSVTAANLAICMAQAGASVLLIDANLRRPTQHDNFGLANQNGLSNFLTFLDINDSVRANGTLTNKFNFMKIQVLENLDIVTSGDILDNASEQVGSDMMMNMLEEAGKRQYDLVLIDSPPCLHVSDALNLSKHADGVLLVVGAGKTSPTELKDTLLILDDLGANMIGIVLNGADPVKGGYYYGRPYIQEKTGTFSQRFRQQKPSQNPEEAEV